MACHARGEHTAERRGKGGRERRRRRVAHDLHHERRLRARTAKRVLERAQLDERHAERPDVRLLIVGLARAQLGREIARRAHEGGGEVGGAGEHARDAKVADLDRVVRAQEDVVRLDVAVHDMVCVDRMKTEEQLKHVSPHGVLGERPLRLLVVGERRVQRPVRRVLHDQEELARVEEGVVVADDEWVLQ